MSNHQSFDKQAAIKKIYSKPREAKVIYQEYLNQAAVVGDLHLGIELNTGKIKNASLKLAELRDEHEAAIAYEKENPKPAPEPEAVHPAPEDVGVPV